MSYIAHCSNVIGFKGLFFSCQEKNVYYTDCLLSFHNGRTILYQNRVIFFSVLTYNFKKFSVSLFQIIQFANGPCIGTGGKNGTCYTK